MKKGRWRSKRVSLARTYRLRSKLPEFFCFDSLESHVPSRFKISELYLVSNSRILLRSNSDTLDRIEKSFKSLCIRLIDTRYIITTYGSIRCKYQNKFCLSSRVSPGPYLLVGLF